MKSRSRSLAPIAWLRRRLDRWLFRIRPAERYPITLRQRRIFVLPTRAGVGFAATLFAMLLASINYSLSLGFALTFLLAGVGLASIFHTFRNLLHLELRDGASHRAHVGEPLRFELLLRDTSSRARPSMVVRCNDSGHRVNLDADTRGCVTVTHRATERGWRSIGRIVIETTYPLGLVRAWSVLTPAQRALVYPALELNAPPPPTMDGDEESAGQRQGDDDFSGLRAHQATDSPRRIAWKAVARGDTLVSKDFVGARGAGLALDWHRLPAGMDIEARLSRLARWVVDGAQAGHTYSLTLPGKTFGPARSAQHRDTCLEALALFGAEDTHDTAR